MMLIEQCLLYYSAPPHRIGYDQLIATLRFMLDHPEATRLHAEIYPAIAEQFHTTPACIDHNLRRVISNIWDYGNRERLSALGFGKYRPSNKIFLFALVRRIRLLETADDVPSVFPSAALFPMEPLSHESPALCDGQDSTHPL